jgi:hypothetical protein
MLKKCGRVWAGLVRVIRRKLTRVEDESMIWNETRMRTSCTWQGLLPAIPTGEQVA